jgi:hypothetical protein
MYIVYMRMSRDDEKNLSRGLDAFTSLELHKYENVAFGIPPVLSVCLYVSMYYGCAPRQILNNLVDFSHIRYSISYRSVVYGEYEHSSFRNKNCDFLENGSQSLSLNFSYLWKPYP